MKTKGNVCPAIFPAGIVAEHVAATYDADDLDLAQRAMRDPEPGITVGQKCDPIGIMQLPYQVNSRVRVCVNCSSLFFE